MESTNVVSKAISEKQIRVIREMIEERKISEDKLDAIVVNVTGQHFSALDSKGASSVIDFLKTISKVGRAEKRTPKYSSEQQDPRQQSAHPQKPITAGQIAYIRDLAQKERVDSIELAEVLRKTANRTRVEDLTKDEASRVITALAKG